MNAKNIARLVLVVFVLAAGIIWYWRKQSMVPREEERGLGAEVFEKAQNPIGERLPDTNPFSADTNPFSARVNPFKSNYKNPF